MLELYKPCLDELWFKQKLLSDSKTMSYNEAYGGTIDFPAEKWESWGQKWLKSPEKERFYRYLRDSETGTFVGEVAYHIDEERRIYLCDVIIHNKFRHRGYGTQGLALLLAAAKQSGITEMYDDIAADNPSLRLFLKNGFTIVCKTDEATTVRITL